MAQPIQQGAASFCISVFGTDNRFTANDVRKRVALIKKKLNDSGIKVLGLSSDGDTRLLKFMRLQIHLGDSNDTLKLPEGWAKYFYAELYTNLITIQDILHILTKLRNALMNVNSSLVLGNYAISPAFLINIIRDRPKGEHNLVMGDVVLKDKMNVTSALKLFSHEVIELLEEYHPQEGKGLILFLTLMKYVYQSFESKELSVEERIYQIWFSVFVVRIWKKKHNASDFISLNAYTCIEINAHMLIAVYVQLRNDNQLEYFQPWLFSSQTCENFFRTARSMTTTESTVINFTPYQFLHRIKRMQQIKELSNKFNDEGNNTSAIHVKLLTDEQILQAIEKASDDVKAYMKNLDIEVDELDMKIGLKSNVSIVKKEDDEEVDDGDDGQLTGLTPNPEENPIPIEISDDEYDNSDVDDAIIQDCSGLLEACEEETAGKNFFVLKNSKGKTYQIKKGSFLYAYQTVNSISTDRLYRFNTARESTFSTYHPETSSDELHVNQWAVFKYFNKVCHVLQIKVGKGLVDFVKLPSPDSQNFVASIYCNLFDYKKETSEHLVLTLSNSRPQYLPLTDLKGIVAQPSTSDAGSLVYFDFNSIKKIEELLKD